MIEKQVELRGKIRSAMTYPIVVLALVLCILAAMLLFIVPIFKNMYGSLGRQAPGPDAPPGGHLEHRRCTGFPSSFSQPSPGCSPTEGGSATPAGRATRDRLVLRVPIFGGLVRKTAMARFSATLSTLLSSGVPVLESLEITSDTVGNVVVANGVRAIMEGAKRGEPLTRPLQDHPVFPPMVTQMMAVGEETGAIDNLLKKVSDFFEQEVQRTVEALTSLIEPLLIVVLGGAVGSMVISLYLPMFDIIKLVGNNN